MIAAVKEIAVPAPEEEDVVEVYKPEFKKLSGPTVVGRLIFRLRRRRNLLHTSL